MAGLAITLGKGREPGIESNSCTSLSKSDQESDNRKTRSSSFGRGTAVPINAKGKDEKSNDNATQKDESQENKTGSVIKIRSMRFERLRRLVDSNEEVDQNITHHKNHSDFNATQHHHGNLSFEGDFNVTQHHHGKNLTIEGDFNITNSTSIKHRHRTSGFCRHYHRHSSNGSNETEIDPGMNVTETDGSEGGFGNQTISNSSAKKNSTESLVRRASRHRSSFRKRYQNRTEEDQDCQSRGSLKHEWRGNKSTIVPGSSSNQTNFSDSDVLNEAPSTLNATDLSNSTIGAQDNSTNSEFD
ncbi:hypothetical protein CROQUDRAFT_89216 [Cronartium quercuum f. sp. fusiforme G11]|uniref:Uncharacterized protein n=1 Tax=Cronartium quercuum f. sp. fusiforme G11 TaxID=708437 RepID=A0A9P6NNZ3_9BASI|nr:hypothetical protein CROQUDRAFT_89216 [Cronartium quercuum f. sp. fusiforme G11]